MATGPKEARLAAPGLEKPPAPAPKPPREDAPALAAGDRRLAARLAMGLIRLNSISSSRSTDVSAAAVDDDSAPGMGVALPP